MFRELLQPPNLVSLSRVALTPFVGYFLAQQDTRSTVICLILLMVAGLTDGLDGYLARRLHQVSAVGKALDPIADKVFATVLVVMLIMYREFPIWLAAVIVGRDLLILLAGSLLIQSKSVVPSSNLTGKYTFAAIAFLLGSYVIRFQFGIRLTTWLTILLLAISTIIYARVYIQVRRTGSPKPFKDRSVYKLLRIAATLLFLFVFFIQLFRAFA